MPFQVALLSEFVICCWTGRTVWFESSAEGDFPPWFGVKPFVLGFSAEEDFAQPGVALSHIGNDEVERNGVVGSDLVGQELGVPSRQFTHGGGYFHRRGVDHSNGLLIQLLARLKYQLLR